MMKTIEDIDFDPEREICAAKKNNDSNHFIAYKVGCGFNINITCSR